MSSSEPGRNGRSVEGAAAVGFGVSEAAGAGA